MSKFEIDEGPYKRPNDLIRMIFIHNNYKIDSIKRDEADIYCTTLIHTFEL